MACTSPSEPTCTEVLWWRPSAVTSVSEPATRSMPSSRATSRAQDTAGPSGPVRAVVASAWRGPGPGRPQGVPLPPDRMPVLRGARLLKRWRYVGVFGPDLMLCIGLARIGPTLQSWWAVWDRETHKLHERTRRGRGGVRFARGRADVDDGRVQIALAFEEEPGIEVVTPDGGGYAWTRKQAAVAVRGQVYVKGAHRRVEALGMVDDSAGYHARETAWRWSTGVGVADDGR